MPIDYLKSLAFSFVTNCVPVSVFGVFVADLCFIANAIPEKGQTILGSQHIVGPGGKGSNQAIAAAKLNGKVNFITKIGNDKNCLLYTSPSPRD